MRPTRPYRALRATVATGVIAVVLGLWAHGQLTSAPMDMLWDVVVLVLLIASGYAVFGRRTMSQAVEDAKDLTDDSNGSDGDQEGEV